MGNCSSSERSEVVPIPRQKREHSSGSNGVAQQNLRVWQEPAATSSSTVNDPTSSIRSSRGATPIVSPREHLIPDFSATTNSSNTNIQHSNNSASNLILYNSANNGGLPLGGRAVTASEPHSLTEEGDGWHHLSNNNELAGAGSNGSSLPKPKVGSTLVPQRQGLLILGDSNEDPAQGGGRNPLALPTIIGGCSTSHCTEDLQNRSFNRSDLSIEIPMEQEAENPHSPPLQPQQEQDQQQQQDENESSLQHTSTKSSREVVTSPRPQIGQDQPPQQPLTLLLTVPAIDTDVSGKYDRESEEAQDFLDTPKGYGGSVSDARDLGSTATNTPLRTPRGGSDILPTPDSSMQPVNPLLADMPPSIRSSLSEMQTPPEKMFQPESFEYEPQQIKPSSRKMEKREKEFEPGMTQDFLAFDPTAASDDNGGGRGGGYFMTKIGKKLSSLSDAPEGKSIGAPIEEPVDPVWWQAFIDPVPSQSFEYDTKELNHHFNAPLKPQLVTSIQLWLSQVSTV